jgi:hypothetical protein
MKYSGYESRSAQRAGAVEDLMMIYRERNEAEHEHGTNAVDLLTDLRHWCDVYAVNFHQACDMSYQHYLAEKE